MSFGDAHHPRDGRARSGRYLLLCWDSWSSVHSNWSPNNEIGGAVPTLRIVKDGKLLALVGQYDLTASPDAVRRWAQRNADECKLPLVDEYDRA